jgi:hypothetical protein
LNEPLLPAKRPHRVDTRRRGAVSLVDAEKRLKRRGRGWLTDAKQRHGSHETGRGYSATNSMKSDLAHKQDSHGRLKPL